MRKTRLLFLLLILLTACSTDPNLEFIQGTWVGTNEGGIGAGGLFAQWQFSRGQFLAQLENPAGDVQVSQGSYRLEESEGDLLMLELYDISGDVFTYNNLPVTYKIEIDRQAGTIKINSRVFVRGE